MKNPRAVAELADISDGRRFAFGKNWQRFLADIRYLNSLGKYDVVYSWGVLHRTRRLWPALDNVIECVAYL
jgi:hypothetical protein